MVLTIKEIIFLESIFHEKIWGGTKLKDQFGYKIPSSQTGECWAVSAHPSGDCSIKNQRYKGKTLSWLWENEKDLFGNPKEDKFPLLTKIIDAKDDLSVQVHPDDEYASKHENGELGKTECWYILDCDEGAELVLGHYAADKAHLRKFIEKGQWETLLKKVPIKPGDFFYIPAGTIHAIGKGTLILETQQSSDLTYRVYDYDRLENGKPRQLHVEKTIDVTTAPHVDYPVDREITQLENSTKEHLVSEKYFSVYKLNVFGRQEISEGKKFKIVSVLKGEGTIDGMNIRKGDHFIIPYNYGSFTLDGDLNLIISE